MEEAVVWRCSVEKVFLEIRPATLLKKRLWHMCFPVNFAKFLRTLFFTEHLQWLLLNRLPMKSSKFASKNKFYLKITQQNNLTIELFFFIPERKNASNVGKV